MATQKIDRKAQLLDIGAALVSKHGARNVTRRMVATKGKVSEALVSSHFGGVKDAQKKYLARAKKLGLPIPTKEQEDAIGKKQRAHGPRKAAVKRVVKAVKKATKATKKITAATKKATKAAKKAAPRKRSVKEVKAIKDKAAGKRPTAARPPKPMPVAMEAPALPPLPDAPALPPLPDNLVGSIR